MISLRPAVPADVSAMLAIEQAATSHPWTRNLFESSFSERYFNTVAVHTDATGHAEVAGFYIGEYIAGEASLFDIAVHPTFQGQGIGQRLVDDFLTQGEARGAGYFFLEVRESNQSAIRLYERCGFCQCGRRPRYYPTATGTEDALLYALSYQN
jgi:ribosomal-protein-alanine N-acetyltransferase